jgi:hypothetical protein
VPDGSSNNPNSPVAHNVSIEPHHGAAATKSYEPKNILQRKQIEKLKKKRLNDPQNKEN